tara:strand:+ start:1998 stop:3260 length:1263 start_codon:yes stop_codon:yes gene_type:complete
MKEILKKDLKKIFENLKLTKENVELRQNNLDKFITEGFPDKRTEDWKFSDLSQIISSNIKGLKFFDKNLIYKEKLESIKLDKFSEQLSENNILILVNGYVSAINFDNEDIKQIQIIDTIENQPSESINSLISLNNAFTSNYLKITVRENYKFKKPLVILNISNEKITSTNINQRFDVVLEKNSQLSIINLFYDNSKNNFININHQFKINENATLKNYTIDYLRNENIKYIFNKIDTYKNSNSENFIFSNGSKFLKNEINCNLYQDFSSVLINGLVYLKDKQHHEIKTLVNHLSEKTKSYQLIKSVLNDRSKAVYQGKIYVDKKAQKTDGYQLSKSLLLDSNTEFDAKPELEIYADDVKCSHGSTSGNLDENSIFYLMSRGISKEDAKKLLINGFLIDVVNKITDEHAKELIKKIIGINEH